MWKVGVIVVLAAAILEAATWRRFARPDPDPGFIYAVSAPFEPSVLGGVVAFVRTPTEISVAADSRAVAADEPSTGRSSCKIFQIGRSNLFIAVAGLDAEAAGGVNQLVLVNRAHASNKTILDTANLFAQAVVGPLVLELERIKSDSEANYARDFEGKVVIAIIFCGFEKHVPVVYQREFTANTAEDRKISIRVDAKDCPGPLCPGTGTARGLLGVTNAALDPTGSGNASFDLAGGAAPAVRKLVQRQIDGQSNNQHPTVRGPIDVLEITRLRATWVEHKPECSAIFPYWRNGLDGMTK